MPRTPRVELRLTTGDRFVVGAIVVLAVCAAAARPLWRGIDPQPAVKAAASRGLIAPYLGAREGPRLDPWERPFVVRKRAFYSVGPDGIDEGAAGDDVVVGEGGPDWRAYTFTWSPFVLLALAALVGGGGLARRWSRAPRGELGAELARAGALAVAPAVGVWFLLALAPGDLARVTEFVGVLARRTTVQVAAPLAGAATFHLLLTGAIVGLRLRRPGLGHLDAAAVGLVLALVAAAPSVQRVWGSLDPGLLAVGAYEEGASTDPWGGAWTFATRGGVDGVWSDGPNGRDDGGGVDDVFLEFGGCPRVDHHSGWEKAYLHAPAALVALAGLILGGYLVLRWIVPRAPAPEA